MFKMAEGDYLLICADFKRAGVGTDVACDPSCARPLDRDTDGYQAEPPVKHGRDGEERFDLGGRRVVADCLCWAMCGRVHELPRDEWARVVRLARRRPVEEELLDVPIDQQLRQAGVRGLFDV